MGRLFDRKISAFKNVYDQGQGKKIAVREFLFDYPLRFKNEIEKVRAAPTTEEQKALKKMLPMATISGLFSHRNGGGLVQPSGLMCIDIDRKGNPGVDMEALKKDLATVPHVAYAGLSCSGQGLFVIVPIAFPEFHAEHFAWLKDYFFSERITIDPSCGDITRPRFVSFDAQPYINHDAKELTATKIIEHRPPSQPIGNNTIDLVMDYCRTIEASGKDITDEYNNWFYVCAALASLGEAGRTPFHVVSRQYSAYNEAETEHKFNSILRSVHNINIGTFFYICNEHGINLRPG